MSVLSALSHALRFGYVRGMYIFDMTHAVHAVSLEMMSYGPSFLLQTDFWPQVCHHQM